MSYNPNAPAATQLLSVSQPIIQGNFSILQNIFDINHVDYNAGANAGKHIYVELPIAAGNPIPPIAFPPAEIAVYAATNAITAVNELYVNKTNQATVVQVPMTASTLSSNSAPTTGAGCWSYLPSGLIMWSSYTGNQTGTYTATIAPAGGPVPNRILTVIVCLNANNAGDVNAAVRLISVGTPAVNNFQIYVSSRTNTGPATASAGYIAIGY